ncbi:MAG: DUF4959 domain-containing protein [Bacteroidales bacterium]
MRRITMKITWVLAIIVLVASCSEEEIGQTPIDSVSPGEVTVTKITNLNGAVKIECIPPIDEDLLYIKALFEVKEGVINETRISQYLREIMLEGFADTLETQVQLIAVDRSKNESKPITVAVKPKKLPVDLVYESLKMKADFGGARITYENPTMADIAIICSVNDTMSGEMFEYDRFYTTLEKGSFSIRGLEAKERKFELIVRDRWNNYAGNLTKSLVPLFEEKLVREQMKGSNLESDELAGVYNSTSEIKEMFDGSQSSKYQTKKTEEWPVSFTMDLGQKAVLSRFKVYQWSYSWSHAWSRLNVTDFEMWAWTGDTYPEDDWNDPNWMKIGTYNVKKPSGLPYGQLSQDDKDAFYAGAEFNANSDAPPVQYLRFRILDTWNRTNQFGGSGSDGNWFFISELEFWGDVEN